ncbi:hypothetical protein Bbelb_018260 [Branchiostoma belcheri]|nr:hypothetical protein Bbelb_018260 [Branchiostoma belcheri]
MGMFVDGEQRFAFQEMMMAQFSQPSPRKEKPIDESAADSLCDNLTSSLDTDGASALECSLSVDELRTTLHTMESNRTPEDSGRTGVDFSHIDTNVDATIDGLKKLKETPGPNFRGLDAFLEKNATVANIQYTSADMDQFMKDVYLPFIDNIVESLQRRFPDNVMLSAFNILKISSIDNCRTEVEGLESEYSVLSTLLENSYNTLSTTQVLHTVQEVHGDTPYQTWQNCDRGFSTMKRVKTPLRNRLKEETLNNLLMISVEGPPAEEFNFNAACDSWGRMEKRRLNILPHRTIPLEARGSRPLATPGPRWHREGYPAAQEHDVQSSSASNFNTSANKLKANVKDFGSVTAGQQLEQDLRYSEQHLEHPRPNRLFAISKRARVVMDLSFPPGSCSCGRCEAMPTVEESVCCQKQMRVVENRERVPGILCITEHHGFKTVCLDKDVLETAHNGYQHQYGEHLGNDGRRTPPTGSSSGGATSTKGGMSCIRLHFPGKTPKTRADPVEVYGDLPCERDEESKEPEKDAEELPNTGCLHEGAGSSRNPTAIGLHRQLTSYLQWPSFTCWLMYHKAPVKAVPRQNTRPLQTDNGQNPANRQPTTSNPSTNNLPTSNPPTSNLPTSNPPTSKPTTSNPSPRNPSPSNPSPSKPSPSKPSTSNPQPVNQQPVTQQPVAQQTVAQQTVTQQTVTQQTVTQQPTTSNPSPSNPSPSNPSPSNPSPSKPQPVNQQPTTRNSSTSNPSTSNTSTSNPQPPVSDIDSEIVVEDLVHAMTLEELQALVLKVVEKQPAVLFDILDIGVQGTGGGAEDATASLVQHMTENNYFTDARHGFVPDRSCTTQLLVVMEEWTDILHGGEPVDFVYLDFKKAFDSVPHKRLLHKLQSCGVTGNSEAVTIRINIFADDSKVYRNVSTAEDRESLQHDMEAIEGWSNKWQLPFNAGKCKVLHLGRNNIKAKYTLGAQEIQETEEERDLGVDNKLKFHANAASVTRKDVGDFTIKRTFYNLDLQTVPLLYKAMNMEDMLQQIGRAGRDIVIPSWRYIQDLYQWDLGPERQAELTI